MPIAIDYDWSTFDIKQLDEFVDSKSIVKEKRKLSQSEIEEELYRCTKSFAYFCRNYAKIVHPIRGIIPFDLRKYQERIFYQYETYRFSIMCKPRQMGCSTLVAIYLLWKALFTPSFTAIILSIGGRESIEFLKKVYDAYYKLPKWLAGNLKEENKHSMTFDNDARIQSLPSPKKGSARSWACSLLVIDETAFIANSKVIWASAFPVVSTGGKVILLSTVNGTHGIGQFFYETWFDALEKNNDFYSIQLHWHDNPEYDEKWFEVAKRNMKPKDFAQEILCDFASSVDTFLPREYINKLLDFDNVGTTSIREPLTKLEDEMMWIFEHPDPKEIYILGADVAKRGKGKSNSSFQILKLSNLEQVAEFQGRKGDLKIGTKEYADVIDKYGKMYNRAYVLVEVENMGIATLNELYYHLHYSNLHYYKKDTPGWSTNPKTRPMIIETLYDVCDNEKIIIHSIRTLREMQTFTEDPDSGKVEKQAGSTDDLLISLGIALNGIDHVRVSPDIMHALEQNKDNMTPEELIALRKQEYVGEFKKSFTHQVLLPNGTKEELDISWLIS